MESKAEEKIIYFPSSASVTGSGEGRIPKGSENVGSMDSAQQLGQRQAGVGAAGLCASVWLSTLWQQRQITVPRSSAAAPAAPAASPRLGSKGPCRVCRSADAQPPVQQQWCWRDNSHVTSDTPAPQQHSPRGLHRASTLFLLTLQL